MQNVLLFKCLSNTIFHLQCIDTLDIFLLIVEVFGISDFNDLGGGHDGTGNKHKDAESEYKVSDKSACAHLPVDVSEDKHAPGNKHQSDTNQRRYREEKASNWRKQDNVRQVLKPNLMSSEGAVKFEPGLNAQILGIPATALIWVSEHIEAVGVLWVDLLMLIDILLHVFRGECLSSSRSNDAKNKHIHLKAMKANSKKNEWVHWGHIEDQCGHGTVVIFIHFQ